jgi:putative DNA primase/helicase
LLAAKSESWKMPDQDNITELAAHRTRGAAGENKLAHAFAAKYADSLRFVAVWGHWMTWDGVAWQKDTTLHTFDRVRNLCEQAKSKVKATTVAAIERLAKADRRLAATTAQWDADSHVLNTAGQDGAATAFDLRTGIGHPPNPLDYVTKKTACQCAPAGTPRPLWTAFLDRITDGNVELQSFLQRYIGYCCTGLTTEHVFLFGYGTGANGKSTFINTIARILGDYATGADMSTFIASSVEHHPTDLAKLMGARLVVAQETQKGRRWDETKIKALTGGDRITARFMRQDFFDYLPAFKLFICGNHKPRLSSVDEAMRRRLLLVPFTVEIPPTERDKDLAEKLKPEWPAILRWMIEGALEWQRVGLAPPASVLDATKGYFADQDMLQQWLDECTEDGGQFAFSRTTELFASWKAWCEPRNAKPGSAQALSEALTDRGFTKKRNNVGQQGFRNLTIKGV